MVVVVVLMVLLLRLSASQMTKGCPSIGSTCPRRAATKHPLYACLIACFTRLPHPSPPHCISTSTATAIMSDIDSDTPMDDALDTATKANPDILFSSANTDAKGKRSAANLPVEAQDTLPW